MTQHLRMAVVAMAIFGALHVPLGRIPVANGAGWDGIDYVAMLQDGWASGGPNTQLRPLIVWLAQPAYALTGSPAQAFDITNYFFTGMLAFLFSRLMQRYGASQLSQWIAIVCISASNAFRLPAYYPVLIDLGGHAMMTLAVWHIIAGPRWAAAAASFAAVLSREYAPVVIVFGIWRDRRLGVPLKTILATYLPAVLIYVAVRIIVDARSPAEGNTLETFVRHLGLWTGPLFPAYFLYFLLTIAGGVSLVLAAQPRRWWRLIRDEPEWLGFGVPIVLVTALVGIDIWRYLTALTPLIVVLFAVCSREWRGRETIVLMSAVVVLTAVTQMPFRGMDLTRYFTEWFPYYAWTNTAPGDVTRAMLWPVWVWRFVVVGLAMCALIVYANGRGRNAVVTQRA